MADLDKATRDLIAAMHVLLGAHHSTHDRDNGGDLNAWLARARDCTRHACAQARVALKNHQETHRAA